MLAILSEFKMDVLTLAVRASKSSSLLECKLYFQNIVLPQGKEGESTEVLGGVCSKFGYIFY